MGSSQSPENLKRQGERNSGGSNGLFPIVGIGASAGGLEALTQFLKHLPDDTGMGFVVVQHLAPKHQSMLPELLSRATKIPVVEATEGKNVEPDHIYVIPPNTDMVISDGVLSLKPRETRAGPPLPIDCFLISLAEDRRNQAIGIILSGSASDGTLGLKAIKAEGGITFAQDERSAKFNSMPHSAISAGYADFVLPPHAIARELARIGRHPYLTPAEPVKAEEQSSALSGQLDHVFVLLRSASGVDFGHYKQTTVMRRIKRRMVVHNVEELADYVLLLQGNPAELQALYLDMLINVTSFFRDPDAFEFLTRKAFPQLMANRPTTLRMWVPGCSTGEEAYSLAMCALEFLASVQSDISIQLLATDISEKALEKARRGRYTEADLTGVSPERLNRFFTKVDGDYQINKSIREVCVFARQNVIKDPPFSRLDLISCRNLLIYLEKPVQRKLVPVFHFALQPNGFLMLGRSESITEFSELFRLVDKKNRIYAKKPKTVGHMEVDSSGAAIESPAGAAIPRSVAGEFDLQKQMDRVLLAEYTPPSIVVNDDLEIVQFHGHTGAYLDPKPGAASLRLLKMARAGLPLELRTAIDQARKSDEPVVRSGIKIVSHRSSAASGIPHAPQEREITLEVRPLKVLPSSQRYFLVLFHEMAETAAGNSSSAGGPAESPEAIDLKRQLSQAKYELQDIIEQLENSNEQLRAANEEIQSNNEELQTTNEELETAKEELQASNEELTTLNEELQNCNSELTMTNNDLNNVISNITVPMVILGHDLRIRRFTASAKKILGLIPADVGRPLTDLRCAVDFPDLDKMVAQAVETMSAREQEVLNRQGHWYSFRVRPYQTSEDRVDGAVITLVDINDLKSEASESRAYAAAIVETVLEPILVLGADLEVKAANRSFYEQFQVSPQETEGRFLFELGNGQWNVPRLLKLLKEVLPEKREVRDFEVEHEFASIGRRTMLLNARQIAEGQEYGTLILLAIHDITEWNRRQRVIEEQAKLLDLATDVIIVRDLNGVIQSWNRGAEKAYGWTREEALGKITHDLLKTEPRALIEEQRLELLKERWWEGELIHTARDGAKIIMASRQVLQRNDRGEPAAVLEINRDITARNKALEQLEHERAAISYLSGRILRLQDEERRRIARELHDSTAQTLTALSLNLAVLEGNEITKANPKTKKMLAESQALAAQASDEIRHLSHLLHPPDLENVGLVAAIRWFASRFIERSKITVELDLAPESERWPQDVEIALFRVMQESLFNIHRHSGSKTAKIRLAQQDGELILEVKDEGHGAQSATEKGEEKEVLAPGVGVAGMRERMRQLGGRLDFVSTSSGTTVKAVVPLENLEIQKPADAPGK